MEQTDVSAAGGGARRLTTAEVIERLGRFDGPPEQFLTNLLAVQCQVGPAECGAILRPSREGRPEVIAVYPPPPDQGPAAVWLAQAAESFPQAVAAGTTVLKSLHSPDDLYGQPARRHVMMVPLRGAKAVRGVAAFVVEGQDRARLASIRERLEMTVGLLNLYEMRLMLQRRQADLRRLRTAMETLAAVNEHDRFAALAMALCNEVATRWQCDRVSLGFLKGRYVQLRALSHTEKFNRRMALVQHIEAAMEECLDQDVEVYFPAPPEATFVSRASAELSKREGPSALLSLPLRRAGKAMAVLTLERPTDKPFTADEIETLRLTADLITPRLANLEEHDKWFGARLAAAARRGAAVVLGPKHTWIKVAAIAIGAFAAFAIFVRGEYRIEAGFAVEPIRRQVVPAPFDGYLQSVAVEPGDSVEGGKTVLASLETAELRLQLAAAKAERATYLKQAAAALRDGKLAESQVAQAQADKAAAQIDLLEYQISQASIISPATGVVITGDLKRRVGAPVKTGDVLFEVAPLESLRGELAVDQEDAADLVEGQTGELAVASFPERRIKFVVERINPVAEVAEEKNVFKVRVRLSERPEWLRPGMEGVAKVSVGERRYIWIWTRPVVNWVRMKLWI